MCCVYYPFHDILRKTRDLFIKIGERDHSDIVQFYLKHIQSLDALRPIVLERKYLME